MFITFSPNPTYEHPYLLHSQSVNVLITEGRTQVKFRSRQRSCLAEKMILVVIQTKSFSYLIGIVFEL
jgi:hypothetical protein